MYYTISLWKWRKCPWFVALLTLFRCNEFEGDMNVCDVVTFFTLFFGMFSNPGGAFTLAFSTLVLAGNPGGGIVKWATDEYEFMTPFDVELPFNSVVDIWLDVSGDLVGAPSLWLLPLRSDAFFSLFCFVFFELSSDVADFFAVVFSFSHFLALALPFVAFAFAFAFDCSVDLAVSFFLSFAFNFVFFSFASSSFLLPLLPTSFDVFFDVGKSGAGATLSFLLIWFCFFDPPFVAFNHCGAAADDEAPPPRAGKLSFDLIDGTWTLAAADGAFSSDRWMVLSFWLAVAAAKLIPSNGWTNARCFAETAAALSRNGTSTKSLSIFARCDAYERWLFDIGPPDSAGWANARCFVETAAALSRNGTPTKSFSMFVRCGADERWLLNIGPPGSAGKSFVFIWADFVLLLFALLLLWFDAAFDGAAAGVLNSNVLAFMWDAAFDDGGGGRYESLPFVLLPPSAGKFSFVRASPRADDRIFNVIVGRIFSGTEPPPNDGNSCSLWASITLRGGAYDVVESFVIDSLSIPPAAPFSWFNRLRGAKLNWNSIVRACFDVWPWTFALWAKIITTTNK